MFHQKTTRPPNGGFLNNGLPLIIFDDGDCGMKNILKTAANATKSVAPRHTFDFGFRDASRGAGCDVRNGRIYEKTSRKVIFFNNLEIVRASR